MVLPLMKLGTLALRTLSKPFASKLKEQARIHPKFRAWIISIAQANHRFTTYLQRRNYSRATDVEIRPLNDDKAVQAAADLLGELFIFAVAGGAVIFEVHRSARSEARKEEKRKQELEIMRQHDEILAREVALLQYKLEVLEHRRMGRGVTSFLKYTSAQTEGYKAIPEFLNWMGRLDSKHV